MKHVALKGLVIAAALTGTALVHAQPEEASASGTTSADGADGTRFRFGVSGGAGFFTVKSETLSGKVNLTYYGSDLRFGAQINDLVAVYAQPTLGYYAVKDDPYFGGAGGLLGVAAVADFTFVDRFFVGAGLGYTVYNNPAGFSPLLRIGGYPLVGRSKEKVRRKGLMLGIDLRFTKLDGFKMITMPSFNIGYEAF